MKSDYSTEVHEVLAYLGVEANVSSIAVVKTGCKDNKVTLRVSFGSSEPVAAALANAKTLKSFRKFKVYLAKDMTYDERQKVRGLVKELRSRIRSEPGTYWTIRDFEVVGFGTYRKSHCAQSPASTDTDSDIGSNEEI